MKNFKRSQTTLEYIMIIFLIVLSIFVMGPYVIRSVNAYMRSWEISAQEARSSLDASTILLPPPPYCGDEKCDVANGETKHSCPEDCDAGLYCTYEDWGSCRADEDCMWVESYGGANCALDEGCEMNDPGNCDYYNSNNNTCCRALSAHCTNCEPPPP